MFRFIVLTILLLLVCTSVFAQSPQGQPHDMANMQTSNIIDGAKTPELIPDADAYRMFLVVASEPLDASPQRKARQRAVLAPLGLGEKGYTAAAEVLAHFKAEYDGMIDQFNKQVELDNAAGRNPDMKRFLARLDSLVLSTRQALNASLGPDIMARFNAHVQREKKLMRVPNKEAK